MIVKQALSGKTAIIVRALRKNMSDDEASMLVARDARSAKRQRAQRRRGTRRRG